MTNSQQPRKVHGFQSSFPSPLPLKIETSKNYIQSPKNVTLIKKIHNNKQSKQNQIFPQKQHNSIQSKPHKQNTNTFYANIYIQTIHTYDNFKEIIVPCKDQVSWNQQQQKPPRKPHKTLPGYSYFRPKRRRLILEILETEELRIFFFWSFVDDKDVFSRSSKRIKVRDSR